jgi:hypothetical protein
MNGLGLKTFTIMSSPFYDQYNQCYKNIMMVNGEPQGPLRRFVRKTKLPRLSPFQREGPCNPIQKCGLAIQSLGNGLTYGQGQNCCKNNSDCNLMTPDEIPDLISFLQANGYQIEIQITNMMAQSEIKLSNKRLSFSATYYGTNQPNITYMR